MLLIQMMKLHLKYFVVAIGIVSVTTFLICNNIYQFVEGFVVRDIFERQKLTLTRTVTQKAEERSLK